MRRDAGGGRARAGRIERTRMGPGRPTTRETASPRGIAVSLVLHLVLVALAMRWFPDAQPPPAETTVAVEIVAAPARPRPPPVPRPPAMPPPDVPAEAGAPTVPTSRERRPAADPPAAPQSRVVRPETMLAARALADPRSRRAREEWRKLFPDERIIQLCNLEAMEQVHAWKPAFDPDFVVAYARADIRLDDVTLEAKGAALRDHQAWFEIAYRCEVTPDTEAVVAFEFELGDAIPQDRWAELLLPSGDGPED